LIALRVILDISKSHNTEAMCGGHVLENLNLRKENGGFVFLAEDAHGVPWLKTHHHRELEINLVLRGTGL